MEVFANLVGVTFRPAEARTIVKALTQRDGDQLRLQTEPFNVHDNHAVMVFHRPTETHIGYVSRENNFEIFEALEAGQELNVQIVGFENTLKPTMLIRTVEYHDDSDFLDETLIEEMPYKPTLGD